MKRDTKVHPPRNWYLLIHQLPSRPLYLRAKIRQRLARAGSIALKRSVYVLPHRTECLEDFRSIAVEAKAGGGEAFVCQAVFADEGTDASLVENFDRERTADYRALEATIRGWRGSLLADEGVARMASVRTRFAEISRIDYFDSQGKKDLEQLIDAVEKKLQTQESATISPGKTLIGQTWVTRRGIQVDRIASAWLLRRFIDRKARFRFMGTGEGEGGPRHGEISFDTVGGDFTHAGDRCTFETLLKRTGLADRALAQIAEVVHDVDLKDGKFGRPEAPGLEMVLTGLILTNPEDEARLEQGMLLFDQLYESFRSKYGKVSKEERQ
jgi:hypothetical protein